jgi:two-component system, chemotaxis family, chemotaxis protein CheY
MPDSILLVEDDDDLREALRELLHFEGYVVEQARTATEAVSKLQDGGSRFRLILLDFLLAGTSGQAVLEARRGCESLRRIPVIVITASPLVPPEDVQGLIQKPFEIEALLLAIREHC